MIWHHFSQTMGNCFSKSSHGLSNDVDIFIWTTKMALIICCIQLFKKCSILVPKVNMINSKHDSGDSELYPYFGMI